MIMYFSRDMCFVLSGIYRAHPVSDMFKVNRLPYHCYSSIFGEIFSYLCQEVICNHLGTLPPPGGYVII